MSHADPQRKLLLALGIVRKLGLLECVDKDRRHFEQVLAGRVAPLTCIKRALFLISRSLADLLFPLPVLVLELVEYVGGKQLLLGVRHKKGVEDKAVLDELLLPSRIPLLEVEPSCYEDLIQVAKRLLVYRLLQVEEEGEEHVGGPEPRWVESAEGDLVHLVEVCLCEGDQGLSLLHDGIRSELAA